VPTPPDHTIDRPLFASPIVHIGLFRCPADHPRFTDSGPTSGNLIVFPRTAVAIQHHGADPFHSDPTIATLYNKGQPYRRSRIDPQGDRSDWFAFPDHLLRDILADIDPQRADDPRPIRFSHAPTDPSIYLLQRLIVRACATDSSADTPDVEEAALRIAAATLQAAYDARRPRARAKRASTTRAHRHAVDAVREAIALSLDENLSLADAASIACLSPYHLSRIFRDHTGQTMAQYRTALRLRIALERVTDSGDDLTTAALAAGFSSHSHFTNRFRERFGVTPSAVRRDDAARLLREIRNSMQAVPPPGRRSSRTGRRSAA